VINTQIHIYSYLAWRKERRKKERKKEGSSSRIQVRDLFRVLHCTLYIVRFYINIHIPFTLHQVSLARAVLADFGLARAVGDCTEDISSRLARLTQTLSENRDKSVRRGPGGSMRGASSFKNLMALASGGEGAAAGGGGGGGRTGKKSLLEAASAMRRSKYVLNNNTNDGEGGASGAPTTGPGQPPQEQFLQDEFAGTLLYAAPELLGGPAARGSRGMAAAAAAAAASLPTSTPPPPAPLPTPYAADIFSFGVVVYEIFHGVPVIYQYERAHEIQRHVDRIKAGWRPEFPAKWPSELREFVARCWAQDPGQRPAAAELGPLWEEVRDAVVVALSPARRRGCCG
jgi:serine/threonine protein kinase